MDYNPTSMDLNDVKLDYSKSEAIEKTGQNGLIYIRKKLQKKLPHAVHTELHTIHTF